MACTRICVLAAVLAAVLCGAHARLTLPHFFTNNMVLQRAPSAARVWGAANAGAGVTVSVANVTATATADSAGNFLVTLPLHDAGGPYQLTVTASSGDSVSLTNVLFGDVFLCSGQSNIAFSVSQDYNAAAEEADANNYPDMRLFTAGGNGNSAPQADITGNGWSQSSASAVSGGSFSYFSATCYFFGREMYKHLGKKVPVGLIVSAVGGTKIELWMSPAAMNTCPSYSGEQNSLFNGKLNMFLPMTLAGIVWWQCEANIGDSNYGCRFPAFIKDMRSRLRSSALPFVYVELEPCSYCTADIRAQQTNALSLGNVGRATSIDKWDKNGPDGEIHPRNKSEIGRRLMYQMAHVLYGDALISGAEPVSAVVDPSSSSALLLSFQLGASKLTLQGTHDCSACCSGELAGSATRMFEAAGADGRFSTTKVSVAGPGQIRLVPSIATGSVKQVRYAWENTPGCALYNDYLIPTAPFSIAVTGSAPVPQPSSGPAPPPPATTTICATAAEGQQATLSCPAGKTITAISFASYGLPSGSCPSFTTSSSCHASSSVAQVQSACVGKSSCSVAASNNVFGDPCSGRGKTLDIAATCA